MPTQRLIEIAKRAANGDFQNLPSARYPIGEQALVRIGSAAPPRGDLKIDAPSSEVEPLHLLLRRKAMNTYELLNVSTKPITVFHPTATDPQKRSRIVEANDSAEELFDYDSVEFGRTESNGRDNYLLTYETGEWVTMEVQVHNRHFQQATEPQYKLTFRQHDTVQATITLNRYANSTLIKPEEEISFIPELRGLDPRYFAHKLILNNNLRGGAPGKIIYELTCLVNCRPPGETHRIDFMVALYNKAGERLHAVARSAIFELVPCGPFELEFGSSQPSSTA